MYELVIIACLSQAPSVCLRENMTIEPENVSGSTCIFMAPELLSNWENNHKEEWVVTEWRCEGTK